MRMSCTEQGQTIGIGIQNQLLNTGAEGGRSEGKEEQSRGDIGTVLQSQGYFGGHGIQKFLHQYFK